MRAASILQERKRQRLLSREPASQAVRERRKRIGELSRGFRCRQRHLKELPAGGWIALKPRMRHSVGIVGSRQSGNQLRTTLRPGLPPLGPWIDRYRSPP